MENTRRILCLFGVALISLRTPTAMGAEDYLCDVTGAGRAEASGEFETSYFLKLVIGRQFSVDRKTGVMSGTLKNNYVQPPKLIDRGSKDNAFKVVTMDVFENTTNIYVLIIDEYIDGRNKPFVFLKNGSVYNGYCRHF
ncbi:hypothetical protein [Kordiimonas sp.]|uniref:hypothetical protein n=1 Tax=Kordiimonas sp. TaxID=1970157 RepID=UPI003A94E4DC